jgi:hypothetical protein
MLLLSGCAQKKQLVLHFEKMVFVKLTTVDEQPAGALTTAAHGEYLSILALHEPLMSMSITRAL